MKERQNYPITFFQNILETKPNKVEDFKSFFSEILKVEDFDIQLRKLKQSDPKSFKTAKNKLPGICIGDFSERNSRSCVNYNPCLVFDIDGIGNLKYRNIILKKLKNLPYVYSLFPSVSGLGIRVLIWTKSTKETHTTYYKYLLNLLNKELNLSDPVHIDKSTKDISRIWYYTPLKSKREFYLNDDSEIIEVDLNKIQTSEKIVNNQSKDLSSVQKLNLCISIIDTRNIIGRNNKVMEFTKLSSEHGLSKSAILNYCYSFIDNSATNAFPKKEIDTTVNKNLTHKKYSNLQLLKYANSILGPNEVNSILGQSELKSIPSTKTTKEEKSSKGNNKFSRLVEYLEENYIIRRNTVSKDIEISKIGESKFKEFQIEDIEFQLYKDGFSNFERMLKTIVGSSIHVSEFNPLYKYLNDLPNWNNDKPDYIAKLAEYVKTDDDDFFILMFKKMLVRSLACSLGYLSFNKQIFCLIGKNQNLGKTSFLRFLCPEPLKKYWQETFPVDDKKDSERSLTSNIYILLDEVKSYGYKELNKLKQRISQSQVKMRLPYGKSDVYLDRIVNFLATTNEQDLLVDDQNVRWLCFDVKSINHDFGGDKGYSKNIDIDNVYAQAFFLLKSGFDYKLSQEEIIKSEKRNNSQFSKPSVEEELIQRRFMPGSKDDEKSLFYTSTDILKIIKLDFQGQQLYSNNVGTALSKLGFIKSNKRINGIPAKGYYVIKLDDQFPYN